MAALLAALLLLQANPPFVRTWTLTGHSRSALRVTKDKVFFLTGESVGAASIKDGRLLWETPDLGRIYHLALQGSSCYLETRSGAGFSILRVDLETRQTTLLKRFKEEVNEMAAGSGRVYLLLGTSTVKALDSFSGKNLWSYSLSAPSEEDSSLASLVSAGGLVVAGAGKKRWCMDGGTGKLLWELADEFGDSTPVVLSRDRMLVRTGSGISMLDAAKGQFLWKRPVRLSNAGLLGDRLIGESGHQVVAVSQRTGEVLWGKPDEDLDYFSFDHQPENLVTKDGAWIQGIKSGIQVYRPDGALAWTAPAMEGRIIAEMEGKLICQGDGRIYCYEHGTLPPLPTSAEDREMAAQALVKDFELLDKTERDRLATLGGPAFHHLIEQYVRWKFAYSRNPSSEERDYYNLLEDMREALLASFHPESANELVKAIETLRRARHQDSFLESLLAAKTPSELHIPVLLRAIQQGAIEGDIWGSSTPEILAQSTHPQAVRFFIDALKDKKASEELRRLAFHHLADTGGPEGLAAVLAARPKPGLREPWWTGLKPNARQRPAPVTKKDAMGRSWTLFRSGVLGHDGDWYMVGKDGKPLFLGFFSGRTFEGEEPTTHRGIAIEKLVSSEWIKLFPDDPVVRRDVDGDGLTDTVEERLGTNPAKKDTDGDGQSDLVDPCPNAAPRELGDVEKVIAAALEARYFEEDWGAPAVLKAKGVEPFELYGYPRTVVWNSKSLEAVYGSAVLLISFHRPSSDAGPVVKFGPDGTTAQTLITRAAAGLNGDGYTVCLRKFGDNWVVCGMRMAFIS